MSKIIYVTVTVYLYYIALAFCNTLKTFTQKKNCSITISWFSIILIMFLKHKCEIEIILCVKK